MGGSGVRRRRGWGRGWIRSREVRAIARLAEQMRQQKGLKKGGDQNRVEILGRRDIKKENDVSLNWLCIRTVARH